MMAEYKINVVGTLTLPETYEDEEGVTQNHTAGVEWNHSVEAPSTAKAKIAFKEWVAEEVVRANAVAFDGVVSASRINETVLLTDAPFTVSVEIVQTVTVDF